MMWTMTDVSFGSYGVCMLCIMVCSVSSTVVTCNAPVVPIAGELRVESGKLRTES